jgi:hypothetical protein
MYCTLQADRSILLQGLRQSQQRDCAHFHCRHPGFILPAFVSIVDQEIYVDCRQKDIGLFRPYHTIEITVIRKVFAHVRTIPFVEAHSGYVVANSRDSHHSEHFMHSNRVRLVTSLISL